MRGVVVGLTGGPACGKSEVAKILERLDIPVWEADTIVRRLQQPGTRVYRAIVRRFGQEVVRRDGQLDRKRLAERVLADRQARADLEAIVHPAVMQEFLQWCRKVRRQAPLAVAVVPLLFEVGWDPYVDATVCVVAPWRRRWTWLRRRGLSGSNIRRLVRAQWPLRVKRTRADYVIENYGSRAALAARVRQWVDEVLHDKGVNKL